MGINRALQFAFANVEVDRWRIERRVAQGLLYLDQAMFDLSAFWTRMDS